MDVRSRRSERSDPATPAADAPPCPLCGSSDGRRVHEEGWIVIRRCRRCRFLFSEEREGDFRRDDLAAEIDDFYRWLEASRDERIPLLEDRLREIAARFGLGSGPLAVLEVGTGGGALALACSRLGHRYLGLEPLLGERFALGDVADRPGVEIRATRLEDLDTAERFDLVALDNVLEHLADPVGAVRSLLGRLRPGGVLWVQVPNEASLVAKHRLFSLFKERRITFPGHVNLFTQRTLERCLREGGAGEVTVGSTSASHPTLTRLLLMRPPGPLLGAAMAFLRATALDVRLGRGYWLDGYARPASAAEPGRSSGGAP